MCARCLWDESFYTSSMSTADLRKEIINNINTLFLNGEELHHLTEFKHFQISEEVLRSAFIILKGFKEELKINQHMNYCYILLLIT